MSGYGGHGPTLLGVTWAEAGIATVLVAARARTAALSPRGTAAPFQIGRLRWDFVWVAVAYTLAISAQAFLTVSVLHGTGNHLPLLSYDDVVIANLWSWIAQVVAISAAATGRFAVIAFLLALQGTAHRKLRWFLYIVGGAQATINAIEIVLIMLQCNPVNKLWDPEVPGTCSMIEICSKVGFLQGSIGSFADLTLALYPILIIGRLQQMKLTLKIGLCVVMSGGVVACAAGINKTVAIGLITHQEDITYAIFGLLAWVWTEMWFIIIFGSIPALRPVFRHITQRIVQTFSKNTGSRTRTAHSHGIDGIQLRPSQNTYSCQTKAGKSRNTKDEEFNESEEDILPRPGQILVRKDTMVENDSKASYQDARRSMSKLDV